MATLEGFVIRGKLSAFEQLDLARKISPAALGLLDALVSPKNQEKDKMLLIVMILGALSQESYDYVLKKSLSIVGVQQDTKISPLLSKDGLLMFENITLNQITELIAQVLMENLGDFLATALLKAEEK